MPVSETALAVVSMSLMDRYVDGPVRTNNGDENIARGYLVGWEP